MKRQRENDKNQDDSLLNEEAGESGTTKIGTNKENKSSNLKKKTTLT